MHGRRKVYSVGVQYVPIESTARLVWQRRIETPPFTHVVHTPFRTAPRCKQRRRLPALERPLQVLRPARRVLILAPPRAERADAGPEAADAAAADEYDLQVVWPAGVGGPGVDGGGRDVLVARQVDEARTGEDEACVHLGRVFSFRVRVMCAYMLRMRTRNEPARCVGRSLGMISTDTTSLHGAPGFARRPEARQGERTHPQGCSQGPSAGFIGL